MLSLCEILDLDLDEMCGNNQDVGGDTMLTLLSNHLGHLPTQKDINTNVGLVLVGKPIDLVNYELVRNPVIVDRGLEYADILPDNPTIIDIVNVCQDLGIPLNAQFIIHDTSNDGDVVRSVIDYMSHGYSVDDLENYYDI